MLPFLSALITPFVTLATVLLLLVQATLLFVAPLGKTVAISVSLFPTSKVVADLLRLTPVTGIAAETTSSENCATLLGLPLEVARMVACPTLSPVTSPVLDTLATLGFKLFQVTPLLVAFAGKIVAFNWIVFSLDKRLIVPYCGLTLIPSTSIGV